MKKYLLPGFVVLILIYTTVIISKQDQLGESIDNPQYQEYIAEYRKTVDEKVQRIIDDNDKLKEYDLTYKANSSAGGTVGNFEGPQVQLKAVKFHNEVIDKEDERLKHIDGVSAHFDPDHPCFGLPDVKISVQDVRLYNQEKSTIAEFLNFGSKNEPRPYKVYRKRIKTDSLGLTSRYFVMQLWLTEFQVNIDINPDNECFVNITDEEKENTTYPGFWYGSTLPTVKLKDLKKEYKDNRYGNLSFILEVIPDNSPIYFQSENSATTKADFAIAAIYCNEAKIGNEPDIQRISTNIHSGQPVFLNNKLDYDEMNRNNYGFSDNVENNADMLLNSQSMKDSFIWNKPYYLKLYFNNLGTWRSGLFNQNQYHDQVNYKFLMPVFVVGSWDIIAPQEILPTWDPPEPYIKKFSLRNLLPFGEMGFFGKIISVIMIIGIGFIGITLIFPVLIPTLIKILKP